MSTPYSPSSTSWLVLTTRAILRLFLASIFFVIITPIGSLMRLFGHDPLRRKLDASQSSYWNLRNSSQDKERMKQPF